MSLQANSNSKNKGSAKRFFFENAYRDHFRKIHFFVYSYLNDELEVSNITQDVFLTLWENLDNLDLNRDALPYLFVVAKYKSLNVLRKKISHSKFQESEHIRHTRNSLAYEALNDQTSALLYSEEVKTLLKKSLNMMPEKVKSTFILSRVNNYKNKEIAQQLEISIKTVEYRLNYALKILRRNLQEFLYLFFWFLLF